LLHVGFAHLLEPTQNQLKNVTVLLLTPRQKLLRPAGAPAEAPFCERIIDQDSRTMERIDLFEGLVYPRKAWRQGPVQLGLELVQEIVDASVRFARHVVEE